MPVLRPLDLICLASAIKRGTLNNIREPGEFVVNLAGAGLADKVIHTAKRTSPDSPYRDCVFNVNARAVPIRGLDAGGHGGRGHPYVCDHEHGDRVPAHAFLP